MTIKFDYFLNDNGEWIESSADSDFWDNCIEFDKDEKEIFYLCEKGEKPKSYWARLYKVVKKKKCKECWRKLE